MHTDVYQLITNRILALLDAGTVPWHKPWNTTVGLPRNLVTGKAYRGINVVLLGTQPYTSPFWLTFQQCKAKGGSVKRGEQSTPVVFWKVSAYTTTDEVTGDEEIRKGVLLRYYNVFNIEQCKGIACPSIAPVQHNLQPLDTCERLVAQMPHAPLMRHGGMQAYYSPAADCITMPARHLFSSSKEYYATLFHEMTHSTGHEKRLNRPTLTDLCPFGSTNYSKEELCAEMGAAYLCGIAGIANRTIDNSAAYIHAWLTKLRRDPKVLVHAAAQAQRAVDYITGASPDGC
jgi:antirestriction protein ArdC